MDYALVCLIGVLGGAFVVFILQDAKRKKLDKQHHEQESQAERIRSDKEAIATRQREIDQLSAKLAAEHKELSARAISYQELQNENGILKRDLRNLDQQGRKLALDRDAQRHNQETLDERSNELGHRYLKESVKWIGTSLNANNFTSCKQRLLDTIEKCRGIGFAISVDEENGLIANLKQEYEAAVRAEFQREEQARIKALMREELKREKEKQDLERKQQQLQREHDAMKATVDLAVARALAGQRDVHGVEIQQMQAALQAKQAEIDANQRAISQAQITKSGRVYVISNIGSFGEGVFKVGMTRRLEPKERVDELGSASVPFPFDIHMMIHSTNAPALENAIHRALFRARINRANPAQGIFQNRPASHQGDSDSTRWRR